MNPTFYTNRSPDRWPEIRLEVMFFRDSFRAEIRLDLLGAASLLVLSLCTVWSTCWWFDSPPDLLLLSIFLVHHTSKFHQILHFQDLGGRRVMALTSEAPRHCWHHWPSACAGPEAGWQPGSEGRTALAAQRRLALCSSFG